MERLDAEAVEARVALPGTVPGLWIFAVLAIPCAAISNGFVSTLAAAMLRSEGMALKDIPNVLQLLQLPLTLYFLWSPMVDFWVRRRTWAALSSVAAGGILAATMQFGRLGEPIAQGLLVLAVSVAMLSSAAVGGLLAEVVPVGLRGRASGFHQAGNLGFGALSGGAMVYLWQHLGRREFGVACGLLVALPGLVAVLVPEPEVVAKGASLGTALRLMGREFKGTFLKWKTLPVLLILLSPMGCGAAIGLLSGMAPDYGVSITQVAWINGVAGGLMTALGALAIGFVKLPTDIRPIYCVASLVNALTLGVLLIGHPRPTTYFVGLSLYMVSVGVCYALFTALVLQLLGAAGKSGGSRYAIALSLGNAPVWYMTIVDGLGARWFGVKGLPGIDMVISGMFAVVAFAWFWWERRGGAEGIRVVDEGV